MKRAILALVAAAAAFGPAGAHTGSHAVAISGQVPIPGTTVTRGVVLALADDRSGDAGVLVAGMNLYAVTCLDVAESGEDRHVARIRAEFLYGQGGPNVLYITIKGRTGSVSGLSTTAPGPAACGGHEELEAAPAVTYVVV